MVKVYIPIKPIIRIRIRNVHGLSRKRHMSGYSPVDGHPDLLLLDIPALSWLELKIKDSGNQLEVPIVDQEEGSSVCVD